MEEGSDTGYSHKKFSDTVPCSTVGEEGSDTGALDQLYSSLVPCSTIGMKGVILVL